jgi:hypothetical protein
MSVRPKRLSLPTWMLDAMEGNTEKCAGGGYVAVAVRGPCALMVVLQGPKRSSECESNKNSDTRLLRPSNSANFLQSRVSSLHGFPFYRTTAFGFMYWRYLFLYIRNISLVFASRVDICWWQGSNDAWNHLLRPPFHPEASLYDTCR